MRLIVIPAVLFCLEFLAPRASANVAAYGNSTQNVIFRGLGANAQGDGQSLVTWGSCVFDGANTKCTVSAPYTGAGLGGGGTITLLITYPGNGTAPLTAVSISPGNDLVNLRLTAGSFVVTLAENSGATVTFYNAPNWYFTFTNATCTGVAPCAVGQVGLTPGATITGQVTGSFDTTPIIPARSVITAGSFGGFPALAPGTWMEIYGQNLANVLSQNWAGSDFNGNTAPTAVGGTTVTIGGLAAFIDFVSPGQVNAQVPSGVPPGPQPVVVTTAGGSSAPYTIQVNATEPGLLAPAPFAFGVGQYAGAVYPGVTPNTYAIPPGLLPGLPSRRARAGDIISFYGIGFGPVTPNISAGQVVTQSNNLNDSFQVSFAGIPATVNYAGLSGGYLGLYLFNVTVPNVAASDTVPVTFSLGGVPSAQTLLVAVQ
jgi:uncharacterized protein (TIGR03437 family)